MAKDYVNASRRRTLRLMTSMALVAWRPALGALSNSGPRGTIRVIEAQSFGVSAANAAVDNTAGMLRMRDEMVRNRDYHYHMKLPPGVIKFTDSKWLKNVRSVTVTGGPTQLQNVGDSKSTTERIGLWLNEIFLDRLGTPAGFGAQVNGNLIEDAKQGDFFIRLSEGDGTGNFVAGSWCLIHGYNQTSSGYPPSLRYFDYRKIKTVDKGVISLEEGLSSDYRSDWVDLATNNNLPYGKARVLSLNRDDFSITEYCELDSLEFLPSAGHDPSIKTNSLSGSLYAGGCIQFIGRNLKINGYFYPTQGRNYFIEDSFIKHTEVDKVIDSVVFKNCSIELLSNGPACNLIHLIGGTIQQPIPILNSRNFLSEDTTFSNRSGTSRELISPASSMAMRSLKIIRPILDVPTSQLPSAARDNRKDLKPNQVRLSGLGPANRNDYKQLRVVITTGKGAGQSKRVLNYDDRTGIATIEPWTDTPDSTSSLSITEAVRLVGRGGQIEVSVNTVPSKGVFSTSYIGKNDPVLRGLDRGSVMKSVNGDTRVTVDAIYFSEGQTMISGTWKGVDPKPGDKLSVSLLHELYIEEPTIRRATKALSNPPNFEESDYAPQSRADRVIFKNRR